MGSVLVSAQASNEVPSKKCSFYKTVGNWPSPCTGALGSINGNTKFYNAFNCSAATSDSAGHPRKISGNENPACYLNMTLATLCGMSSLPAEAHWVTALANANRLLTGTASYAAFPYSPTQVVSFYGSASMKAQAYQFFSTYCETYA